MFEVVNRTVTEEEAKNIDSNICLLCNKGDNKRMPTNTKS